MSVGMRYSWVLGRRREPKELDLGLSHDKGMCYAQSRIDTRAVASWREYWAGVLASNKVKVFQTWVD